MTESNWPIKAYYKYILALAYFPEASTDTAMHRLTRWIRNNRPLSEALLGTGYSPAQKSYTPRQVGLIFEYLGEP